MIVAQDSINYYKKLKTTKQNRSYFICQISVGHCICLQLH